MSNPTQTRFFYQGDKLVTIQTDEQQHSILRYGDIPLAEVRDGQNAQGGILVTDEKGSVFQVLPSDKATIAAE